MRKGVDISDIVSWIVEMLLYLLVLSNANNPLKPKQLHTFLLLEITFVEISVSESVVRGRFYTFQNVRDIPELWYLFEYLPSMIYS